MYTSVFALAQQMTIQPGIHSVSLAIFYSESSIFDGELNTKEGLARRGFASHVIMRARAESQDAVCQQITSMEKRRDGNIVKPFKCAVTQGKVATQDDRGEQMDPPKILSGVDDSGWSYSSLHAALYDSSTVL